VFHTSSTDRIRWGGKRSESMAASGRLMAGGDDAEADAATAAAAAATTSSSPSVLDRRKGMTIRLSPDG